MIKSELLNKDNLKNFYNKLNGKYEGYIQLSDKRIEDLFLSPTELPKWDKIISSRNFIYEAAFFDEKNNVSVLIRQVDDKWLVNTVDFNKKDDKTEITEEFFIAKTKNTPRVKIKNIWQEQEDELCNGFPVLKHIYSAFAGFEKGGRND